MTKKADGAGDIRCYVYLLQDAQLNILDDAFRVLKSGKTTKSCRVFLDKKKQRRVKHKCPHGRRRGQCKECKGSQICHHEKVRAYCKECKGSQICEHEGRRACCKDCKGSQIWEHERVRSQCKECKGSQICHHEKRRSQCKECKGSQICPHEKLKYRCKECKGSQICKHEKRRSQSLSISDIIRIYRKGKFESIWKEPRAARIVKKC
ncbi:uncharacterized protein LOC130642283 [Hydractinia symbiolongicarpus]|uniref:uncharacterized protein LOC130642283 n=1 Tax=Hydractinia symbiolongicarpus TaxID=13093 RepID=UPI00254E0BA5|nr:uncharacterized protein LOC130642283 [Hydractinia symbiolongicarpus]